MSRPAARSVRAVPSVATRWKPSPANAAATGTAAALSASRTDRNTVPSNGSGRPAARSAFAKAVGRSAALAITSPVARISGPSTGSAPGKRANGSTAAFTLTCFGGRSAGSASSSQARARRDLAGGLDEVDADRLRGERHRARRARVHLEDEHLAVGDGQLHVQQADDAERRPEPADDLGDLGGCVGARATAQAARRRSRPNARRPPRRAA